MKHSSPCAEPRCLDWANLTGRLSVLVMLGACNQATEEGALVVPDNQAILLLGQNSGVRFPLTNVEARPRSFTGDCPTGFCLYWHDGDAACIDAGCHDAASVNPSAAVSMILNGERVLLQNPWGIYSPAQPFFDLGTTSESVQISANAPDKFTFFLYFEVTRLGIYQCSGDNNIPISIQMSRSDGDNQVLYGIGSGFHNCIFTLTGYDPDVRAVGTFTTDLPHGLGAWPVPTLHLLDGRFDVPLSRKGRPD